MGLFPKSAIAVLLLAIFTVLPQSSGAQEDKVDETSTRQSLSWTELVFKGSKFLINRTVQIKLSSVGQLSGDLTAEFGTDIGDCSTTRDGSRLLTVHSSSGGMGFSQNKYEEKIWFSETTIHPDMRIRLNSGNSPWIKGYCWGDKGVHRQKNSPGKMSENEQLPAEWTKRTASFYKYPDEVMGCGTISDPALLLYIVSTQEPDSQVNPFEICVFGKKQLHRLTIRPEISSPLKVSYKGRTSSQELTVEDKINPAVFSITTAVFAQDEKEPETFSFFGLHKDITIYMDSEKRLPVRITGANNSFGDLVLDLRAYSN